jgi:hypothetical protein
VYDLPTSGEESNLNELGLDDDPGQEEAEGGHQVDEGRRGATVVPRVPAQTAQLIVRDLKEKANMLSS